jgi:hypothetical protein
LHSTLDNDIYECCLKIHHFHFPPRVMCRMTSMLASTINNQYSSCAGADLELVAVHVTKSTCRLSFFFSCAGPSQPVHSELARYGALGDFTEFGIMITGANGSERNGNSNSYIQFNVARSLGFPWSFLPPKWPVPGPPRPSLLACLLLR